jgi:hypothetical protein
MSNSEALKMARLVQIAGTTESSYGPAQWDAAKALGYNITQEICGQALGEKASFGFVAKSLTGDETVVAFRGTAVEKLLEWVEDANCELAPCYNGKVHEGFLSVYNSLSLEPLKVSSLTVCGHSLGAALATMLAYDVRIVKDGTGINWPEVKAFTFGSPRVGDASFEIQYSCADIPTARYVNRYDLVPTLPLGQLGYEHVGTEIRLSGKWGLDPAEHHEIKTYIALLEAQS